MFNNIVKIFTHWSSEFFEPPSDPLSSGRPKWPDYVLLILFFVLTRLAVLLIFQLRGTGVLLYDAWNYLRVARYLGEHGLLLPPADLTGRVFPGLPLLMALLDKIIHQPVVSGFIVSWLGSIGSALIFLYLFGNFRLALVYLIFIPQWVGYSASISSEGWSIFCYLLVLAAVRISGRSSLKTLLLAVSGFAMVVRPTTCLVIFPLIIFSRPLKGRLPALVNELILVGLAPIVGLGWNYLSQQNIFLQAGLQAEFFRRHAMNRYPPGLFSWPGHSIVLGFFDVHVLLIKKTYVALHLAMMVMVIRNLLKDISTNLLTRSIFMATIIYSVFVLLIGGSFGFLCLERYLAQINPFIIYGLFQNRDLKWHWIALLGFLGVLAGGAAGMGSIRPS